MCEMYHVLPRQGGALDQHPDEIRKLLKVQEIIEVKRDEDSKKRT